MWDGWGTDVRLAVRSLSRTPGLAAAAVLVLGLGIGANATVFTALKTAVLSPIPFPESDRLVIANITGNRDSRGESRLLPWSYPKFRVLQETPGRLIDPIAGYATRNATWSAPGEPEQIDVEVVSADYFDVLGLEPAIGRGFGVEEEDPSATPMVVVISHELWQTRFGGDPGVLGRTATINGRPLEVVGVAPSGFDGLRGGARAWLPMLASAELFNSFMLRGAHAHWFNAIGRIRPGARFDDAASQMAIIGDAVDEAYPSDDPGWDYGAGIRRLSEVRVNDRARASVFLLSAAALLVLMVACANLSGLLLARARRRTRDGALRLAVGASRWRLVRASMTESLILSTAGGLLGIVIALWGTRGLAALWPSQFLQSGNREIRVMNVDAMAVDSVVLAFSVLVLLVAAVAFGLWPALRSSSLDLSQALKDGQGATQRGRRVLGLDGRAALVATQVALALLLVVGTGLVGSSMARMLSADRGFTEDNVLVFSYSIPRTSSLAGDPVPFHDELRERVLRLPGVEDVTLGCAPLRGHCWGITRVDAVEGGEAIPQGEGPMIGVTLVGDSYFETLGVPLLEGRALGPDDGHDASPTMVINRRAAAALFPGESALGRRIQIGVSSEGKEPLVEIVGVVDNVLYDSPDQEQMAEAYYSYREFPDASVTMLVRTSGSPTEILPRVRTQLREMAPDLALSGITTVSEVVSRSVGDRRIIFTLLAVFAVLTGILSATGTWGIVSHTVVERHRELGLRLALGAGRQRVLGLVLRSTTRTALLGLVVGSLAAMASSRVLGAFLYDTSRWDPPTYVGGALLLLGIVLLASYLPARRATRVDPVEALRSD